MAKMQFPMDVVCISSPYGETRTIELDNGKILKDIHTGIDMTGKDAGAGDLILTPHNGYVVWSGVSQADKAIGLFTEHWGVDGCPKGYHFVAQYWHLYRVSDYIKPKYQLTQGEIVGKEGATGMVKGAHLHFGLYLVPDTFKYNANTISASMLRPYLVNPLDWLYLYPHQTIRKYGNGLESKIKILPAEQKKIVTVRGELLKQEGDVFTIKGGLV